MAKYVNSGLIPSIRGSVGDVVFSYWRGIPVIRKRGSKRRGAPTKSEKRMEEIFGKTNYGWKKLSFEEEALWEEYTKRYPKAKREKMVGLMPNIGGKMSGANAYTSLNALLMRSGFNPIKVPPLGKVGKPPLMATDLRNLDVYWEEVKFNVWLPRDYMKKCVAQVWVKLRGDRGYNYLHSVVPVSTTRTEVVIDKIRVRGTSRRGVLEKGFNELGDCKLSLQMRTVAENGEFSMAGMIYKVRIKGAEKYKRKRGGVAGLLSFLEKVRVERFKEFCLNILFASSRE